MKPDSVALLVPAVGTTDLDDMLGSLGENRFDEIIVAIDCNARNYVLEKWRLLDLDKIKEKYPFVIWCENHGKDMINETINTAYVRSTSEWIWITHEDVLFPQQLKPHPNFRFDLRVKTVIRHLTDPNIKSIQMHYFQIPNGLDTRNFAHMQGEDYVSDINEGGGTCCISTVLHRSVIESIEKAHGGRGFDLGFCTYYDTQVCSDAHHNRWKSMPLHDTPSILHKVSTGGRYTNNCNDFEPNKKWKSIGENSDAWRAHVAELYV